MEPAYACLQGLTALVVEDDWVVRYAILEELLKAGCTVLEASTGELAVNILDRERIDLLVTDIQLAGVLTGWDVAEYGRACISQLPVLYISGSPPLEARLVADSRFLPKPQSMPEIIAACAKLIPTGC
jgi:CheY-like chemotaxis protein